MKKRIIMVLVLPILLLGLCACGNKVKPAKKVTTKKIELVDEKKGFRTVFTYDKNLAFSDVDVDTESGASTQIEFDNVDLDLDFEMYYTQMSKESYDSTKDNRTGKKYYKEYVFGDYEAYIYGDYSSGVYMNILLQENKDTKMVDVLFVSIDRMDSDENVVVADVLDEKELQDFFGSISFKANNN